MIDDAVDIEGEDDLQAQEPAQQDDVDTGQAMQSVQEAIAFGRERHGMSEPQEDQRYSGLPMSTNIDDRRDRPEKPYSPTDLPNADLPAGGAYPRQDPEFGGGGGQRNGKIPGAGFDMSTGQQQDRSRTPATYNPALSRPGSLQPMQGMDTSRFGSAKPQRRDKFSTTDFADGGYVEDENDATAEEQDQANAPAVNIDGEEPYQDQGPEQEAPAYQGTGDYTPDQGPKTNVMDRVGHTMPRFATTAWNKANEGGDGPVSGPARRFMSYLSGQDAAPPDQVSALEQQVDPEGILDEGTRKLLAIDAAKQSGGNEAAWAAAQHYRKKYDAYRGFAAAALSKGDVAGAAQAAQQAYPNLLDGTDVKFTPAPMGEGVVATLSSRGRGAGRSVNLTPAQFNEFLVGPPGQYDTVLEVGIEKLMSMLTQRPGTPPSAAQGPDAPQGPPLSGQGAAPQETIEPGQDVMKQGTGEGQAGNPNWPLQGQGGPSRGQGRGRERGLPRQATEDAYTPDPKLEAQAMRIFPNASQHTQRADWIARQEQQAERNKIDAQKAAAPVAAAEVRGVHGEAIQNTKQGGAANVADINAKGRQGVAEIRAGAARDKVDADLKYRLAKIAADSQNAGARNAARILEQKLKNVPLGEKLSPEDQATVSRLLSGAANAPPAQQQNAPQPAGGRTKVMVHPKTGQRIEVQVE